MLHQEVLDLIQKSDTPMAVLKDIAVEYGIDADQSRSSLVADLRRELGRHDLAETSPYVVVVHVPLPLDEEFLPVDDNNQLNLVESLQKVYNKINTRWFKK